MDNSRLFKVIYNNESRARREMRTRLMKQFEDGEDNRDLNLQEKERMKHSDQSSEKASAHFAKELRPEGSLDISDEQSKSTEHIVSSDKLETEIINNDRSDSMEIENCIKVKSGSDKNIVNHRECDMSDDEFDDETIRKLFDTHPMFTGSDQKLSLPTGSIQPSSSELSSMFGESKQKKKCLEKERRPPDANINPGRKDSLSSASNRSSLDPINEENATDDLALHEKSEDSSIEIEEIEHLPRSSRERTSSILSSNRSSLEPIQEDLETNEMDINVSSELSSAVENCEEITKELGRRSSRTSKISLETITEEGAGSQPETDHDLIVGKHPLPFPSKQKDFTWFDLQSPMIKPSRKRRFEDSGESSFLDIGNDEWNVSCEETTLPYNVHEYRQSFNTAAESFDAKNETCTSSPSFQSSASNSHPGWELKQTLMDLRAKVSRHENSIRKISEALHASRGVNANLNEHMIHCHRNLLTERQSRQVLLEEIDRLERDGQASRSCTNGSCGNLVISNISLPLKPSTAQVSTEEPCDEEFYFICLLKCPSGRLVPSDMLCVSRQSRRESVDFRARFSLSQVPSDFIINLEIYAMTLIRRSITGNVPQDASEIDDSVSISSSCSNLPSVPYQVSSSSSAKRFRFIKRLLTPSKSGKRQSAESNDVSINDEEDEGWRTTGFSILSSIKLTRDTVNQTEFPLGRIPHLYPLAGNLRLHISLNYVQENIEERGFLSVFSHVGGFGSWQRLWCVLKPNRILMWRYPDEEINGLKHIRTIELNQCLSDRVTLASKDICFRPQTLVMLMTPLSKSENRPVQLLLSADTKSDRVVWCNKLNRCLSSLRSWNPSHFEEIRKRFRDK